MKKENWHEAKVIKIAELTADIKHFWLQVQGVNSFDFKPGQYVTLDLSINDTSKDKFRSYSIASAPVGDTIFELVLKRQNGEQTSDYLFNDVIEGASIKLSGPHGKFILPQKIESDICFICTGTGITPLRSMLQYLILKKQEHKKIFLFFGTRYLNDVLFRSEFEELQKKFPQFTYQFVLSKEVSSDYKGIKGYVHQLYEKEFFDKRPAYFYICGWRGMIHETRERLYKMGYSSKDIHQEIYQ